MPKESFLSLPHNQQLEFFKFYIEEHANHSLEVAEKDLWVCWVLKQLFEMPERKNIAFKGGTSLSKAFNIIDRFSEDIDITIDYRDFEVFKVLGLDAEPTMALGFESKQAGKRFSDSLIQAVKEYSMNVVMPYLQSKIKELPNSESFSIDLEDENQSIRFNYPTLDPDAKMDGYMRNHILIEFGGRNVINPNEIMKIAPYISVMSDDFEFPTSLVTVLAAERTFWEKATLIHVECHRGVRENAMRLSRHWFDLMRLYQHQRGLGAIKNFELLKDVVALKSVFYNAKYANYDKCMSGEFVLVPDAQGLTQLKNDYEKMVNANYMSDSSITFEQIIHEVQAIQDQINAVISERQAQFPK